MQYILQVIIYTAIMLFIYMLFLRNRPMYQFSRYYLIICAILPMLVPFVQLPGFAQQRLQNITALQIALPAIIVNGTANKMIAHAATVPTAWLAYGLVAILFMSWYAWHVIKLRRIITKSKKETYDGYSLITSSGYGPGSYGRYIFFPEDEVNNTILEHERAHIQLHHTRDIVLLSLLQAVLWPNLFLLWIKKELREVHEFQADALIKTDKQEYAQLILSSIFNTRSVPEMHLFILHPIKRRIMMLQKNGKASPLKAIIQVSSSLCLLLIIAGGIQSCDRKNNTATTQSKYSISPQSFHDVEMISEDSIKKSADIMPQFEGDNNALNTYLSKELKYPEYARANKIEGRVIVKFIVSQKGTIINPEIVRSPDSSLSREALAVVKKMPKWEPGRMKDGQKVNVAFYLPISFKLN